jgi:hypothetical protein
MRSLAAVEQEEGGDARRHRGLACRLRGQFGRAVLTPFHLKQAAGEPQYAHNGTKTK